MLLALAALLAAIVVGNVVEHRGHLERVRTLAAHPGVVEDLSAPLAVAWRIRGPVGGSIVGSLALLQEPFRSDTPLRAVDLRSGAVRWELPRSGAGAVRACTGDQHARAPDLVLCWRVDGSGVLVVDADDGTVLARHAITEPSLGHVVVDDDVVLVHDEGTHATFRRVALRTGEERWRVQVELGPPPPYRVYRTAVRLRHGVVVLEGATTVVVDAASGDVLGRWVAPDLRDVAVATSVPGADVVLLPIGYAVWSQREGPARSTRGMLHRTDSRTVPLEGVVVEPEVTDGSAAHVLLLAGARSAGNGLVAVHAETGEPLWRTHRSGDVLLRIAGTVVLADESEVVALDAASGAELWRTAVPGLRSDAGWLTDGEHLLVATLEQRAWTLVALRLDGDGTAWRSPAPGSLGTGPDRLGGAGGVQARAGVPVLVAPGELTGLRR